MEKEIHWLEKLMTDHNIKSRYALAKQSGLHEGTLQNFARLKTPVARINVEHAQKLAMGLEMTVDEFIEKY